MKITCLGTGSIVPTKKRSYSGVLIDVGDKLLFDCGPSTLEKLTRIDQSIFDIEHLFVTHYHIDHITDMLPLIMSRAFDPMTGMPKKAKELNIYGPGGLKDLINSVFSIEKFKETEKDLNLLNCLKLKEVTNGLVEKKEDWSVSCAPTEHFNGIAYRVEAGKKVVYSGDTAPCNSLIELAKNCDLLIHECSCPDEYLVGLHTSPSQLGEIASKANVKKLILNHLYPVCNGEEATMIKKIKEKFDGEVLIAEDFMTVEL